MYQIGVQYRATGKRTNEQVAVMQNIFYDRNITKIFDLKGSLRGRFAAQKANEEAELSDDEDVPESTTETMASPGTLLDGDFLQYTLGRPLPMTDRAKAVFHMSILNVSLKVRSVRISYWRLSFSYNPAGHFISFHYQRVGLLYTGWGG